MSKLKTKTIEFSKETGAATYVYQYKNHVFVGEAQCHDDDKDFCSEKVGIELAEIRAFYQYLKIRRDELAIRVETLDGCLRNLMSSREYNTSQDIIKKIQTSLEDSQIELFETRHALKKIPSIIQSKIAARDDLYKKIRERRKTEKENV